MRKLKTQYQYDIEFHKWKTYLAVRNRIHRHFSTKQEKSFYFMHKVECLELGYPIRLRAARGKALANPWDDYPSSVCKMAKNWKYNSKRIHQYYR